MSGGLKPSRYNIEVPLSGGRKLVFNSVSHQMILVSSDADFGSADTEHHNVLEKLGFLVEQERDELVDQENAFNRQRNNQQRMMVTVAPTLHCNLACGYCFQGMNKPANRMSEEVQQKLVERIAARIPNLETLTVTWYGGEPLMNAAAIWPISDRLISLCEEHDVTYRSTIVTNGYLLTPETADRLVRCKVTAAQITIDGLAESHDKMRPMLSGRGSYDRIMENICAIVGRIPLNISIRVNVDVRNAHQVHALLNEFADRGLSHNHQFSVYFAPIEAITSSVEDGDEHVMSKSSYADLEVELLSRAVQLGLTSLGGYPKHMGICQAVREGDMVVLPSGDLHKCWDTVQDSEKRHATIWDEGSTSSDHAWLAWSPYKSDVCRDCKILPICGGACAFKTVHKEETAGEAGALPCPSLKFNLAERLFLSARANGEVSATDWDPERSPTWASGSGKLGPRHSADSVARFAAVIAEDLQSPQASGDPVAVMR